MATWMEGASACRGGTKREDNPYSVTSDKGKDWFRGWDLTHERKQQPVESHIIVRAHHRPKYARA